MNKTQNARALFLSSAIAALAACTAAPQPQLPAAPALVPTSQPSATFSLNNSDIHPMYAHLLAVDLPTVQRLAFTDNLDIQQARLRVDLAKGQYESSVEAIFPVIAPALAWSHFDGTNQNASGTLVSAAFNDILPAISVQWILNPGKVAYDIIAARRRLYATEDAAHATDIDTARRAANQFYELVLAQARLAAAQQALAEVEELERITTARLRAGTGLQVDQSRAQSDLARRRQDLTVALNSFYQSSITLALILRLDPSVTLVPKADEIRQTTLVKDDTTLEQLLDLAATYRPDLQAAREIAAARHADKNAIIWGGLGPQLQAGYTAGGIATDNNGDMSSLHGQQKASASAGFQLGLSTFGQAKVATTGEQLALVETQKIADQIRATVIIDQQNSLTESALIPLSRQRLDSASETLRLAQANLKAGTGLTIDILQAQDALEDARLRYIESVARYNQSQVDLLAALGLLKNDSLGETAAATPTAQPAQPTQ